MTRLEKMALGRRKAYLQRCIRAQELLEQHEKSNTLRMRTFDEFIWPELRCSYQTFYNMMNEKNPRKQLESLLKKMEEKCEINQ